VWLEVLWLPVGENDEVYVMEVLHNTSLLHSGALERKCTTSLCPCTGSKRLLCSQPHSFSLCPYNNATPRPAQVYFQPDHKFPEVISTQLNIPFEQQIASNTNLASNPITPILSNTTTRADSTFNMSSNTKPQRGTKRAADGESDTSHWVRRSTRARKTVQYFQDQYAEAMEDTTENIVKASKVTESATSDDTNENIDDGSDDATDDTEDDAVEDATDDVSDEDPVVPPGRTRKAVNYADDPYADVMDDTTDDGTSDHTDEDPVVPLGRPRNIVKRALPHDKLVEDDADDTAVSPEVTAPKASRKADVKKKLIAAAPSPPPSLDESEEEYDHDAAIATERVNQAAALALLQPRISRPTSLTTVFGESAMRDSLEPDKVNDDLCAAAASLRELSVEAADSQEDDRSSSVEGSDASLTSAEDEDEDEDEDVVPSASNKYKFTSDSSTGRTADELNSLFRPPPRMPRWQLDLDTEIKLSYTQLGVPPRDGLVRDLVKQIEKQHEKDVKKAEKEVREMSESEDEDEED
jgi:hypothetical protein